MKTNKKLYSIILSLAMMLSTILPVFAEVVYYGDELTNMPSKTYEQKFNDVTKFHWAFDYISEMSDRKVLSGYPDGNFYPEKNVTRAEFAKIMTCAAGLTITKPTHSSYEDISIDDWYNPYVETAKYYLSGYTNNGLSYYFPNSNALREDIAVALVKLKGYDTTGFDLSIIQTMFSDWQSISAGAQKYVAVAVENGLISGYDDGTFKGQKGITRAEAATLLWRAYQYGNANKDFEQEVIDKSESIISAKPYSITAKQKEITFSKGDETAVVKFDVADDAGFTFIDIYKPTATIKDLSCSCDIVKDSRIAAYTDDSTSVEWVVEIDTSTVGTYYVVVNYKNKAANTKVIIEDKTPPVIITEPEVKDDPEPVKDPEPEVKDEPEPVKDPEPEPKKKGWMITTIKNGIDDIKYIQTVPNGVSFMTGTDNNIYELNDSGKMTVVYNADDFPYQGTDELSKRDVVKNKLICYGYNNYDNCYYALIEQHFENRYDYLVNINTGEIIIEDYIDFDAYPGSSDTPIKFYKNGDFQIGQDEYVIISPNGKIVDKSNISYYGPTSYPFLIFENSVYVCNYDCIEGVDCEDPDWDVYGCSHGELFVISGVDKFYARANDYTEITSLDINGNAGFLLAFNDIENEEGRKYSTDDVLLYGAITSDESAIYFHDHAYGSIRKIQRQ